MSKLCRCFIFISFPSRLFFIYILEASMFGWILEMEKKYLVGVTVAVAYITYYLVEAVKRPVVVCGSVELAGVLATLPVLRARYWPTPWCVEARLQTVLGSVLRSLLLPPLLSTREVFKLSDGGQVALDWVRSRRGRGRAHATDQWEEARGIVVLLPGLTGTAQADYARSVCAASEALGARCAVLAYRGAGGLALTTPRLYSAVSHGDLEEVLAALAARHPAAPLLAVGVSLGGLILAQYLAARGESALLAAALLVSAPLDVERAAAEAERLANVPLARHMARNMRRTVRAHPALRASGDWRRVEGARSLRQFDAAFTARHFGFASAEEYYAAATLRGRLGGVRVPLLCLCAADDPFQPARALPRREAAAAPRAALAITARGGHIGFLEGLWPAAAPRDQYIARLAREYFAALLARPALLHSRPAP